MFADNQDIRLWLDGVPRASARSIAYVRSLGGTGQAVEEGAQFCRNCGAPAPQASAVLPPTPSPIQAPPPPRRNRMGLIIGSVVAGIIVLAALGVGLYFGLRGNDSGDAISSRTTIISSPLSSSPSVTAAEAAFSQKQAAAREPVGPRQVSAPLSSQGGLRQAGARAGERQHDAFLGPFYRGATGRKKSKQ